jgi:phosphohistidine phosphatase
VPTLLLLRHAKSSWDAPQLDDRDRPLAPRGVKAATRMAVYLASEGLRPDLVLCSPARRTRETLELLGPALQHGPDVRLDDRLYGADVGDLLSVLRGVEPATGTVLVVGHNPGLHDVAVTLAGDGDADAMAELRTKLPTAALVVLEIVAPWPRVAAGGARLTRFVLPRRLG